jgi:hypothetical protein
MRYVCYFLLLFSLPCLAQKATVENVVQTITADLSDDSLKVVRIFDWIISNIKYDRLFEARRGNGDTTLWQEPYNVVVTKMAVCIGYSKLFKAMCQAVGVEAYVVEGMTKNALGYFNPEGHAWNVVKIKDNWYLADATWSGNLRKYFMMRSAEFHENHLPDDPMWQLSEKPISYACFTKNKNCSTAGIAYFNYRDTIAAWQKMDSLSRLYNESKRSLAYNPENIHAIRGMAQYYGDIAGRIVTTYLDRRKEVMDKKRLPTGRDSLLTQLEKARIALLESNQYYERLLPFAKADRYTDAHLNMDLIRENLVSLEKEKNFVLQYFRD